MYLYTWTERRTIEGERIPVRTESMEIGYIDGNMLLPLILEHPIDERSPLMGHTHDSLLAVPTSSPPGELCAWTVLEEAVLLLACPWPRRYQRRHSAHALRPRGKRAAAPCRPTPRWW